MPQLGRYEILQQLATGPVADVLLARAKGLEGFTRHVVVKQIRPELATDERFVKAFLDEARIGASLHHQNIVQVYDIDEDRGAYYFTMEYVHGEDVRKLLLKVRELDTLVPLDQVVTIGAAAAAGLHHAHEQVDADRSPLGLVHRDVSPGNILIGYDGSVKLVDFGLAKPALSAIKTRSGAITTKAPYMSPELCQGKPIDRRSDIFALGIVLYELATARRLFKGENDYLTMASIVEGEVAPPSTHRPDIPRALDEIILRALAKSPEARFQNAVDLRAALEAFAIETSLRTSSKALADYMVRMFGARAEPWQVDAPAQARIDSEGDFDEGSKGLVSAPSRVLAMSDSGAPIALARAKIDRTPFLSEAASRTSIDMDADDEHTATATSTVTVPDGLSPAADLDADATVRADRVPGELPPKPRAGASAVPAPVNAAPTRRVDIVAPATPAARNPSSPKLPAASPAPPIVARTMTPKKPPPVPPSIGEDTTMPAPPPSATPPPAILGTPKDPSPAVPSGHALRPILGARVYEDDQDDSTVDSADEATTVQPPMFVTTTPPPDPGRTEPQPIYPAPMPPPAVRPITAITPLRPAWLRYTIVVLGLAIPLAVGFGSRSCAEHAPIGVMP